MKKQKNYFQKLFTSYSTLLIGVLLLLFLAVMIFVYRQQYEVSIDTQITLAEKTKSQLDLSLKNMDQMISGLMFNDNFSKILADDQAEEFYSLYRKEITDLFSVLDAPLFPTHRIIAFNRNVYYTSAKPSESRDHILDAIQSFPWWDCVVAANGTKVFLPIYQDVFDPQPQQVYSVARAVFDHGKCLGLVVVQNTYEQLEKMCSLVSSSNCVAVFSETGQRIYPLDAGDDTALLDLLYEKIQSKQENSGSLKSEGQQLSYSRSKYSGWTTIVYAPTSQLTLYARTSIALSLGIFLLLTIIFLSMNYLLTRRLTAPLINLKDAVERVSIENLSLKLPVSDGITEINAINHSFETMFRHLKDSIAQSIQSRANEERANYLALQAQMNPHTLYNTISMIESVSYMNGDLEVSNLCICFSHMLRYISDYTKRIYTVQDELQHLEDYATLTMKRYEGILTISASCAEDLAQRELPKLTIQPLVENAVKHGFCADRRLLSVDVNVSHVPGGWQIQVMDSGQGFAPGRIEELEEQFLRCDQSLTPGNDVVNQKIGNLALSNIYIRCRIQFGNAFHIRLGNNSDGPGCFVTLIFLTDEEKQC